MSEKLHPKNSIPKHLQKLSAKREKLAAQDQALAGEAAMLEYRLGQKANLEAELDRQRTELLTFSNKIIGYIKPVSISVVAKNLLRAPSMEAVRQIVCEETCAIWVKDHADEIITAAKTFTVDVAEQALNEFLRQNPDLKNCKLEPISEVPVTPSLPVGDYPPATPPLPLSVRMAFPPDKSSGGGFSYAQAGDAPDDYDFESD